MNKKIVAIVSGGLDSVTLAYYADRLGDVHLLSFDYGQRHKKELEFAKQCAYDLKVAHYVVDISDVQKLLKGSALTDDIDVPEGHYADESMKATVVPNRNAIMLSIAVGYAVSINAKSVMTAVHAGDHPIYPDCRPEFIHYFDKAARMGTDGFREDDFRVVAPFVRLTKAEIVALGQSHDVPFSATWSCYKGGEIHCGACGTCRERREAFQLAQIADPTLYASTPSYSL
jgi:7-cyano-7-deazaguanine synthase